LNQQSNLVSVIIPVYNSEKFVSQAIESVLNQTFQNIEVIAIDDGSTDNSLEILQQFSEKIKIISKENEGLVSALELGIKNMNGRWFKWFSPDDVLYDDAIETLVKEIEKFPENTIVYSNWELIDEENKKLGDFSESNYNELEIFDFNVQLLDGQQINVNTTLIPKSLFDNGCNIRQLKDPVAIDYDFFLRAGIIHNTRFHLVPETIVKYRISRNQLSHKKIVKTLSYLNEIRSEILSHLDDSKRNQYLKALKEHRTNKSLSKKTLELGLKLATESLPEWVSDRLIVFYLNKIRRAR